MYAALSSTARGFAVLSLLVLASEVDAAAFESSDYTWLLVCAAILAFFAAFGIGANDVANAFATSVGAKSISIKTAIKFAAVCEFGGAVAFGSQVAKTMRKGIADVECFENNPGLLMYGMTMVIFSVGMWLMLATYLEMPVSTTHSCVGGIIGMTMMSRSLDCVTWYKETDNFPYVGGVAGIVVSWFLSPVASGIASSVFYGLTYVFVLRDKKSSFRNAKIAFPIIVFITFFVNVAFFMLKGAKGAKFMANWDYHKQMLKDAKDGDLSTALEFSSIVALICGVIAALATPYLAKNVPQVDPLEVSSKDAEMGESKGDDQPKTGGYHDEDFDHFHDNHVHQPKAVETSVAVSVSVDGRGVKELSAPSEDKPANGMLSYVNHELNADPHRVLGTNATVGAIHSNAQRHDFRAEEMFKIVQVFSACVCSFSHGANDVANAMGPFTAVYITWKNSSVESKEDIGDDMLWILAIGGAGIVVGLAMYGYKIITAIGVKLTAITPSRGYCIELGSALVVIYGTSQGWPLSTTHCQIGATVGVGLCEGRKGVNGNVLGKAIFGWFITLVVCGVSAAMLVGPNPEPINCA